MMPSSFPTLIAPTPDPWLAVNYSLVFPGLGQLYSGYRSKGAAFIVGTLALLGGAAGAIFGAQGSTQRGLWLLAMALVVYSFSILDAYRGTQPGYATRISIPQGRKDPWYAVFLSQVLPGLGHLYLQQAIVGGLLLILAVTTARLATHWPLFTVIPPMVWAFSCYHTYHAFPHRSQPNARGLWPLLLGILLIRLLVGIGPVSIQQAVEQCIVTSESMQPTIQVGDRLFVRRAATYQPAVGDIIVFTPPPQAISLMVPAPANPQELLLVKRAIGLPGQRVEVTNGQVYIDGQPLLERYVLAPANYQWGPALVPPDSFFGVAELRDEPGRDWNIIELEVVE